MNDTEDDPITLCWQEAWPEDYLYMVTPGSLVFPAEFQIQSSCFMVLYALRPWDVSGTLPHLTSLYHLPSLRSPDPAQSLFAPCLKYHFNYKSLQ